MKITEQETIKYFINQLRKEKVEAEELVSFTTGSQRTYWEGRLTHINMSIKYLRINGIDIWAGVDEE